MWGNLLIGGLSDQAELVVWSMISSSPFSISMDALSSFPVYKDIFASLLNPWSSNEPPFFIFISFMLSMFGPKFFNVFLLLTFSLNIYFSYLLFRRFKYPWFYVLIFNLSSYFWIHLGEHLELNQLWLYCWFFHLLIEKSWLKHPYKFGFIMTFISLISNYIGFFVLVYYSFYVLFYYLIFRKDLNVKEYILTSLKPLIVCVTLLVFVLFPYVKVTYLNGNTNVNETGSKNITRTLDDYVMFSSRPWYFLLPPTGNILLGSTSQKILDLIKSTNNYLADDYFPREHSANYFGLFFIISFVFLFIKNGKKIDTAIKKEVALLVAMTITVFILMMPPKVTINGMEIYNISFIFYKLVPLFRVTARMSVLIHLGMLLIFGYLMRTYKFKLEKLFLGFTLIITLLETNVPVRTYRLDMPEAYAYLRDNFDSSNRIIVYPYSKSKEALFWLPAHKQLLLNPRGYMKGDFSSEKFTTDLYENLDTLNQKLDSIGVEYIVNFDSTTYASMDSEEFRLVKSFKDSVIYEIQR